jgi:PAS domain S-box-containing protein
LAVFIADAAVSAWRRGDRRLAVTMGGGTLFFVVGVLAHSALVAWQVAPRPLMISLYFVGVVVAMSYETTREALRAGVLADDLRESEARYRSILERSSEGIYRTSAEGRILFANPATAKILGYDSPEELMSSVTDLASQVWADPGERSRLIRLVEEGGLVRGHECRFRQKDGTPVWVSLSTRPFRGPDGHILYFDGIFENIDERKRAETALRKNRRLLEEMEKVGNVGGWEIDLETMKLTWTPEIYDIHEVDPSFELTVEKGIQFYAPASRPVIERLVRRAIEHGEPFDAELELFTARGRLRNVHAAGRVDAENRRVFGFFQDITSRKENEREMAELRSERAHLLRVLTVDELSTSLAHEINQPLGAILNNAEAARILLAKGPDKAGTIPEIVDDIIQDARRAGDIIRKVRRVLKKSDVQFERLPVNGLIEESLEIVQNSLALNNVMLRRELAPDVADIGGDRVRLQQVLLNLVTNALDAMKEAPSKVLTLRSAMEGPDTVTVSVEDSGPGVAEGSQGSVFQPFFTTKKGGLGLGLAICRSIVEEHEGRIWQVNDPGRGAIFSFSLKAWRDERP